MCKFAYTITLLASVYSLFDNEYADPEAFFIKYMPTNNSPKKRTDVPCVSTPVKVAVLIDGGFFIKRYNAMYNKSGRKLPQTVDDKKDDLSGTRLARYLNQKTLNPFIYREKTPGHFDAISG